MTYLPSSPEAGGPMLAAYIAADPARRAVFDNVAAKLGTAGKVDCLARYYIVRTAFRREVFRGVLVACACRIPDWAHECHTAGEANREFINSYRDAYNAYRREVRNAHA